MSSIYGTVVDSAGVAVAGARVALKAVELSAPVADVTSDLFTLTGVLRTESDAAGRFSFSGLRMSAYVLMVRVGDMGARSVVLVGSEPTEEIVVVQLWGHCTGNVVDEDGNGVEGAVVMPAECISEAMDPAEYGVEDEEVSPAVYDDMHSPLYAVLTGRGGAFRFEGPLETNWRFVAHVAGYPPCASEHFQMGSQGIKIQLHRGFLLHGTVRHVETEEPMAGFPVTVRKSSSLIEAIYTKTDEQGRFTVPVDIAAKYDVTGGGYRESLIPEHVELSIGTSVADDAVELFGGPCASVSGRVVDADTGEVLTGLCVTPRKNKSDSDCGLLRACTVDESGTFELSGVAAGSYHLVVTEGNCNHDFSIPLKIVEGPDWIELRAGEALTGVRLAVQLEQPVEGIVLDSENAPMEGVCIMVVDLDTWADLFFRTIAQTYTRADGCFRFRCIKRGRWHLLLSDDEREKQMAVPIEVPLVESHLMRIAFSDGDGRDIVIAKAREHISRIEEGDH